jgi:hypothetical protein
MNQICDSREHFEQTEPLPEYIPTQTEVASMAQADQPTPTDVIVTTPAVTDTLAKGQASSTFLTTTVQTTSWCQSHQTASQ